MINLKRNCLLLICLLCVVLPKLNAQSNLKYAYAHGKLNANRTWFDVVYYNIALTVLPPKKFIQGSNQIYVKVIKPHATMQLDLQGNIGIDSICYMNKKLAYTRDSSIVLVNMPKFKKNKTYAITVYFSGYPVVAKKAPWDGGFVFANDSNGFDWVGLACQGEGASLWLPCKDHLSDEPDSMRIKLIVPKHLTGVSNGRLEKEENINSDYKAFTWYVSNPINNYNITVNIGNYVNLSQTYQTKAETQPLALNYYVLKPNQTKALAHFEQVKKMLSCFEMYFGAYPFWNDGYKLVETPYWGMEHQSAVSYGNGFKNNLYDFDFIIIHESAHEYFGNSVTAADPADLWIHESFTTYAEALYVECTQGYDMAINYLKMQRKNIVAQKSMLGIPYVYYHGFTDNDIYYKGTWMLHTLRHVIANDSLWFKTLLNFRKSFHLKPTHTHEVMLFFEQQTGKKLRNIFEAYLNYGPLPVFEYKLIENNKGLLVLQYRLVSAVPKLTMPVEVVINKGKFDVIEATANWKEIDLNYVSKPDFKVNTDNVLLQIKAVQ